VVVSAIEKDIKIHFLIDQWWLPDNTGKTSNFRTPRYQAGINTDGEGIKWIHSRQTAMWDSEHRMDSDFSTDMKRLETTIN